MSKKENKKVESKSLKEELAERACNAFKEDTTLEEVFSAFEPDELYIHRSRRGHVHINWNQEDNRYIDDAVWTDSNCRGRTPNWVFDLFEIMGVEKK